MSWWDTGEGEDVIGDQSADIVRQVLTRVAEERRRQGRPKPSLSELLGSLGTIAAETRGKQLEGVPENLREVVAELKSGGTQSGSTSLEDGDRNRDLAAELRSGLDQVATIYQSRWERKPRLSEWLKTFSFVLRYRPEHYLEDGRDRVPVEIAAR